MRTLILILTLLTLAACGGKSIDATVDSARDLIDAGDYDAATIELKSALQQDSDSAEARWLLGMALLETGEILSAEKQLLHAEQLGWTADDIRPALAKTLLAQGKTEDVLALGHDDLGNNAAARLLSTQAMAALADRQNYRAGELVDDARQKDPDELAVKLAGATLLVREDDTEAALALVEEIQARWPEDSGAQWLKGQIYLLQGDLEAARAAIDRSIETASDTSLIDHIMRALVSVQLKDYESALADAAVVLEHNAKDPTANYIVGVNQFHQGEYRNAIAALNNARPVAPQFPLVLYYLSSAYLIEKELALAESFASEFYKRVPDNRNGRKLLAAVMLLKDQPDQAREILQPVLDQNPGDVEALNFMANAQLMDGQSDLGMILYAQIARLDPDWEIVPLPLGGALVWEDTERQGGQSVAGWSDDSDNFPQTEILTILNHLGRQEFPAAIEAAESYHFRDPSNVASLNVLGRTYFAAGEPLKAREAFERALKREPRDPSANWSMAELSMAAGDADAARKYYESILYDYPRDLTTLMKLAELEAAVGNQRAMASRLDQAIRANPTALEPRLELAQYYIGSGSPEKIEPLFEDISPLLRSSPRVLELVALAQLGQGENEAASATLDAWIDEDASAAQAYYLKALTANAMGDTETSKDALLKAIEQDSQHLLALLSLAKLARVEADSEAFEGYLATLVQLAPGSPEVLRLQALQAQDAGDSAQAVALSQQVHELAPSTRSVLELVSLQKVAGDGEAARATLAQWIEDNPGDIDARLFMANDLSQSGDIAGARAHFEAVLEEEPDNVTALNNLAWTLRKENPGKALEYGRKALAIAPDAPQVLDTVAVIEHLNGRHADARKRIRKAMQVAPGSPTLLYHDAMISAALGDEAQAIAALESALEGDTEFPERAEAEALLGNLRG